MINWKCDIEELKKNEYVYMAIQFGNLTKKKESDLGRIMGKLGKVIFTNKSVMGVKIVGKLLEQPLFLLALSLSGATSVDLIEEAEIRPTTSMILAR